jgi:cyclophilin family peptidyl-prolyl cis-trans isomerase
VSKANKRERQRQNRELARVERERMVKRQRQTRALRSFLIVFVPLILIVVVISLIRGGDDSGATSARTVDETGAAACRANEPVSDPDRTYDKPPPKVIKADTTYTATVCTAEGAITLELDPVAAPVATNNFVFLAEHGFYDGLDFHRAAENFVIQGGDPAGDGSGGPGYTVVGEVPTDNYPEGALAAAKSPNDPAGTFGSQFFIVTGTEGATLPNDYARFGKVVDGIDVAKKIESYAPESGDGPPTKTVEIRQILVNVRKGASSTSTTAAPTTPPASEAPPTSAP